jgi:hypothetical protein
MRNLFLLICLSTLSATCWARQRVLPEYITSLPVFLQLPKSDGSGLFLYGTGMFLNHSNGVFLVTAAHCVFDVTSTNCNALAGQTLVAEALSTNMISREKSAFKFDLRKLLEDGNLVRHPKRDICVIRVATNSASGEPSYLSSSVKKPNVDEVNFAVSICQKFDEVQDAADAFIFGYPIELMPNETVFHPQIDFSSPLIRRGVVAQKNWKFRKLIVDSGVYGGNSGGPVVISELDKPGLISFRIVGVVTQFVPYQTKVIPLVGSTNSVTINSGYLVAEPIDYAIDLMDQF